MGHGIAKTLHCVPDIPPLEYRAVQVTTEQRDDCLLERVQDLGGSFQSLLFLNGGKDVFDHLLLDSEDIGVTDNSGRIGRAGYQVGYQETVIQYSLPIQVIVAPEVVTAFGSRSGEVEEYALLALSRQPRVDSIR